MGYGERAGRGHRGSESYVHAVQSLRSSPFRHEVDLSSSGGEGRRRREGELAVQGGEGEAGARPVSSGGKAPPPVLTGS